MFQRAQQLARQGDNVVARKLLLRCVELNPYDSHRYHFLLANSFQYLILLLSCSWLALARLEAKWGAVERSREIFTESVERFPNNIHILQAWGHMEQVISIAYKSFYCSS